MQTRSEARKKDTLGDLFRFTVQEAAPDTFRISTSGNAQRMITHHNSLIDCHSEVWTRFPVQAPIHRENIATAVHAPPSITFVSSAPSHSFAPYFFRMVKQFEENTRKPTQGLLGQIKVTAQHRLDPTRIDLPTSEFQAGDWLVGLFCLIPICLAVARSNQFIPLKDGVDSPHFQQSLLGASTTEIFDEWVHYTTIFVI
jgi:hypothetical protein